MDPLPLGGYLGLHVAVVGKAGTKVRRFGDQGQGKTPLLEEPLRPIPILLLTDNEGQCHRKISQPGLPKGDVGLRHRGAASLHIRGPQPLDSPVLLLPLELFPIRSDHSVEVPQEEEGGPLALRKDDQVFPLLFHPLKPEGDTGLLEAFDQNRNPLLLLSRGRVSLYEKVKKLLEPLPVEGFTHLCSVSSFLSKRASPYPG
ncbi:MAG: hypothetical protein BWY86_01264 [Candidatus Aminicenantes bacterium ADurb.Bin508]|nr:MAG: hypothetical protein BWY86_01264 [Candidatus Aminicenantes bacterium ADurb.Bin508]